MPKRTESSMNHISRVETTARMSRVVIHNGVAYLSGQVAGDRSLGIEGQMQQTLERIEELLAKVGCNKGHLLTAQIWLKDVAHDFEKMNAIWDQWTIPGAAPTRATAQAEMAAPNVLVEIIVSAAIP